MPYVIYFKGVFPSKDIYIYIMFFQLLMIFGVCTFEHFGLIAKLFS